SIGFGLNSPTPDATIGFDSDSLNIIPNAVTQSNLLEVGVSGGGGGLKITGFSDTVDVSGLFLQGIIGDNNPSDTIAAILLRAHKQDGAASTAILGDTETVFQIQNFASNMITILGSGQIRIGTDPADNTKMDIGITIDQRGENGEIFTLKSSDVAHGVTTVTETDTSAAFTKLNSTSGGLLIRGFSDGDARGMLIQGVVGSTNPTDTTSAGMVLRGGKLGGAADIASLADAETVIKIENGDGTDLMNFLGSGQVVIGTTGADNTKMDIGITIDQNTEDGEAIALKSTGDVLHGVTVLTEATTFASFQKFSGANGGLNIRSFSDTDAESLVIDGIIGSINPTD
ncbi:hypothetical protein LCGC14_3116560, partial [marine sediment metagenome]